MKVKNSRLETLKMLISSQELSSQDQVLQALAQEGYAITQATLSRDLKLLKVAKAASPSGKYTYVLPNFSGNMVVIKTRPGYASSIAYNIDNSDITPILGTIAGDDTIFLVKRKGASEEEIVHALSEVIPEINQKN